MLERPLSRFLYARNITKVLQLKEANDTTEIFYINKRMLVAGEITVNCLVWLILTVSTKVVKTRRTHRDNIIIYLHIQ